MTKHTFFYPAVIAAISGIALFVALLADGWWHWIAWIGLAVPALVSVAAIVGHDR